MGIVPKLHHRDQFKYYEVVQGEPINSFFFLWCEARASFPVVFIGVVREDALHMRTKPLPFLFKISM